MSNSAGGIVCLGIVSLGLSLSLGCTQPIENPEGAKTEESDLSLWQPIGVIEEIDIKASADVIWRDLLTASCYSHWNPWLSPATDTTHPAQGAEMELGDNVTATVITATGQSLSQSTVTVVTAPGTPGQPAGQVAQFCWKDTIPVTSHLIPAYRCRTFTANSDGSIHYKHDLELQGVLNWLAYDLESASLHKGMAAENQALKNLAESGTLDPLTCAAH
jgi:hypothetical protein